MLGESKTNSPEAPQRQCMGARKGIFVFNYVILEKVVKPAMAVAVILAVVGISGQLLVEPTGAAQTPGVAGVIAEVGSDSIPLKPEAESR